MKNFLFEDLVNGGYFFVQCDNELECEDILLDNGFDLYDVRLLDVLDDYEAELLGYDTY